MSKYESGCPSICPSIAEAKRIIPAQVARTGRPSSICYEAAIQHSPLRILYDDFVVKEDSRNGGYAITEIVTLNNQMSLLDYGTVRTQSNSVWEKIGGIAHFVGEEGEE